MQFRAILRKILIANPSVLGALIGRYDFANATTLNAMTSAASGNVYATNILKASKYAKGLAAVADIAGYYNGVNKLYQGKTTEGAVSLSANYIGIQLGKALGWEASLGWSIGWNAGEELSKTKGYSDLFGSILGPERVRTRGMENGWWTGPDEKIYQDNYTKQIKLYHKYRVNMGFLNQ